MENSIHEGFLLDELRLVPSEYYIRLVKTDDGILVLVLGAKRGDAEKHCDMALRSKDAITRENIIAMLRNLQGAFRADEFGDKFISVHREIAVAVRDGRKIPLEYRPVIKAMDMDERELTALRGDGAVFNWSKYLSLVETAH